MTTIEWTDATWNPVRGCSRVSPGCDHCYAMGQAHRFNTPARIETQDAANGIYQPAKPAGPYHGLTTIRRGKVDWSGIVRFVPEMLDAPLRWRKPRRVFVNSMSDLFHESLSNEQIAVVFGVMVAAPQHTFQVLTKRPQRARQWFKWVEQDWYPAGTCRAIASKVAPQAARNEQSTRPWPLPNVWLGTSCEDQQRADERIPELLACPAAVRFVSAEPLLGPIDLTRICENARTEFDALRGWAGWASDGSEDVRGLDWVIAGGESGNGARRFDLQWGRDLREQCAHAGVAFFFKQTGSRVFNSAAAVELGAELGWIPTHSKGGDPTEWPEDLRVRQFPEVHP